MSVGDLIFPQQYYDYCVGLRPAGSTYDHYSIADSPSTKDLSELSIVSYSYKYDNSTSHGILWTKESSDKINFRDKIEWRVGFGTTNADSEALVGATQGTHFLCCTVDSNKMPWIYHSQNGEPCVDALNYYSGSIQTQGSGTRNSSTNPTQILGTSAFSENIKHNVYMMQIYPYALSIEEAEVLRKNLPAMYPGCVFNGLFGYQGTGLIIDLSGYQNDATEVGTTISLGTGEPVIEMPRVDIDYDLHNANLVTYNYVLSGDVTVNNNISATFAFNKNSIIFGNVTVNNTIFASMAYSSGFQITGDVIVSNTINATTDFTRNASILGSVTINQNVAASVMEYARNYALSGDVTVNNSIASAMLYTSGAQIAGDITATMGVGAIMDYTLIRLLSGDITITFGVSASMIKSAFGGINPTPPESLGGISPSSNTLPGSINPTV